MASFPCSEKRRMKKLSGNYVAYLAALVIFMVAAMVYCRPVFSGKELRSRDGEAYKVASQEVVRYRAETGYTSWWTGSMFCGMPTYQISGGSGYHSSRYLAPLTRVLRNSMYSPVRSIVLVFACFFLLLLSFGFSPWLCLFGALSIGLSSYFIVLIPEGHVTKLVTIAFGAGFYAGYNFIFRKRYLLGSVLVMAFITSGYTLHPQMFYYFCMLVGLMWFADAWSLLKEKKGRMLCICTAVFALSLFVGLGAGSSNFFANREYLSESVRSGSALAAYKQDAGSATMSSKGLSLEYAASYSYGIDETLTLLIPGFKGGSSVASVSSEGSEISKALKEAGHNRTGVKSICKLVNMYWGKQPYTAGNVYVGAVVLFFFLLSLMIVTGVKKWMLLACTAFSIMLAWGSNLPWFTELFMKYFPLYDKFRVVSSILVVAEVTIPVLGLMAVAEMLSGRTDKRKLTRSILVSAGTLLAVCLFFAVAGGWIYDFSSSADTRYPEWFSSALCRERRALFVRDCFRSSAFVAAAASLLLLAVRGKMRLVPALVLAGVISFADLWAVDHRYFNSDSFSSPKHTAAPEKPERYVEILSMDKDPDFRVFNTTVDLTSDTETPAHFKSIGGYSAVRLSRYQDLMDEHISKMHTPVLDMLNAKYSVVELEKGGEKQVLLNPQAMGNAWWVNDVRLVDNPREEIDALMEVDLHSTAVVNREFSSMLPSAGLSVPGVVRLTSYKPDCLEYKTQAVAEGLVVFSEIYYPYG